MNWTRFEQTSQICWTTNMLIYNQYHNKDVYIIVSNSLGIPKTFKNNGSFNNLLFNPWMLFTRGSCGGCQVLQDNLCSFLQYLSLVETYLLNVSNYRLSGTWFARNNYTLVLFEIANICKRTFTNGVNMWRVFSHRCTFILA